MKLYTYCVRYDSGSAPNPFWGICTLAICKPSIRKTAEVGDWIAGFGSSNSPIGNISDCIVYIMKVTKIVTMEEYDRLCSFYFPKKIPNWRNKDYRYKVGDCIYDYKKGIPPKLRLGVHTEANRERDLSGKNVLISDYFYYFGDNPERISTDLKEIIHNTQGHKSKVNAPYVANFISWVESLELERNKLYGDPQRKSEFIRDPEIRSKCSKRDLEDDSEDKESKISC